MDPESRLRLILARISNLLTKENVKHLVFATMKDVGNRQISEECQQSGNPLKIFQVMIEKDLYSYKDPALLIQHMEIIGGDDAIKMIKQEITASSQDHLAHQPTRSPENERSGGHAPKNIAEASTVHLKPANQSVPLPTDRMRQSPPMTLVAQPSDACEDGGGDGDQGLNTGDQRCAGSSRFLEPEASLFGDPRSPKSLPDIDCPGYVNPETVGSSPTTFRYPETARTHAVGPSPGDSPKLLRQSLQGSITKDTGAEIAHDITATAGNLPQSLHQCNKVKDNAATRSSTLGPDETGQQAGMSSESFNIPQLYKTPKDFSAPFQNTAESDSMKTATKPKEYYADRPERPPRERHTVPTCPFVTNNCTLGSDITHSAVVHAGGLLRSTNARVAPDENYPKEPERALPESYAALKCPPVNGDRVSRSEQMIASSTSQRICIPRPDLPLRNNTREAIGHSANISSLPESHGVFKDSRLWQPIHGATPEAPHHEQEQPGVRLVRAQDRGSEVNFNPNVEVEPLQGRPPPIPARPPRRHYEVEESELCRLAKHFNAFDIDLFGQELGRSNGEISQLKYQNPHDTANVFYQLMIKWRSAQRVGSNMRENLANHIRNIQRVGLANDLRIGRYSRL